MNRRSILALIVTTTLAAGTVLPLHTARAQLVPVAEGGTNLITNLQNTIDTTWQTIKSSSLDAIAWGMAKAAMNQITSNTISWINSGFEGEPAFVSNPGRFLEGVGEAQFNNYIDTYLEESDQPFARSVARLVVEDHYGTGDSSEYTLDEYFETDADRERFLAGDFSKGGWEAWNALTQNPMNNPIGAYTHSSSDATEQAAERREIEQLKLNFGDGFRSLQSCLEKDELERCVVQGAIRTPGKIIQNQLTETLGSPLRQLENADELNEILSAVVGNLMNSVIGSSGLTGSNMRNTLDALQHAEDILGNMGTSSTSTPPIKGQDISDPTGEPEVESAGTSSPPA